MELQIILRQTYFGIKLEVSVHSSRKLYFYNLNLNSYLTEFLEEIQS